MCVWYATRYYYEWAAFCRRRCYSDDKCALIYALDEWSIYSRAIPIVICSRRHILMVVYYFFHAIARLRIYLFGAINNWSNLWIIPAFSTCKSTCNIFIHSPSADCHPNRNSNSDQREHMQNFHRPDPSKCAHSLVAMYATCNASLVSERPCANMQQFCTNVKCN